ncbi:MAG: hypothetical protein WBV96_13760, partial [Polyangia bacterium]
PHPAATAPSAGETPRFLAVVSSTGRRYEKAGVDIDDRAAIAREQERRRMRRQHHVAGYLTGRQMATGLGISESKWRTLRKKAKSEGWKPAEPINGKTLFRIPEDVNYFKALRAKMKSR